MIPRTEARNVKGHIGALSIRFAAAANAAGVCSRRSIDHRARLHPLCRGQGQLQLYELRLSVCHDDQHPGTAIRPVHHSLRLIACVGGQRCMAESANQKQIR